MILSFDPGLRGTGVAVFDNKRLVKAAYVRSPEKKLRGAPAWQAMAEAVAKEFPGPYQAILHEQMQIYRAGLQKGNPNDLLELAGVCGWICGLLKPPEVKSYFPREWKGQVPKEIHGRRILAALSAAEQATFQDCPKSLLHNLLDGVGIGLHYLGRS